MQFSNSSGGGSGGFVSTFQNGSAAYLLFAIWGNDPSSEVCTVYVDPAGNTYTICTFTRFVYDYGWGEIPSTDLTFTSLSAELQTTTGVNFTSTHCVTNYNPATPVTTCAPGAGGSFDLLWSHNDFYTELRKGKKEKTFGSFTFRTTGSVQAVSKFVSGTALGHTVEDAPGMLGTTRGRNTARDIVTTP